MIGLSIYARHYFMLISDKKDYYAKQNTTNYYNSAKPPATSSDTTEQPSGQSAPQPETNTPAPLPDKAYLKVPFLVQAPFAVWDDLHQEACEEASLIMVKHYIKGTTITSSDSGDKEIINLVNYVENHGYKIDVTVAELNQIAKSYYGLKTGRVKTNATVDDIKREITAGKPVIIPAAGKLLPNPNFRAGGPLYHMLVVKGYDENGFITNDPGTRKGEDFHYKFDDLYNALHDWNPQNILEGQKAYLVFD